MRYVFVPEKEALLFKKPPTVECELALRVRTLVGRLVLDVPFHADRHELVLRNIINNAQPLSFSIILMHDILDLIPTEEFWKRSGISRTINIARKNYFVTERDNDPTDS